MAETDDQLGLALASKNRELEAANVQLQTDNAAFSKQLQAASAQCSRLEQELDDVHNQGDQAKLTSAAGFHQGLAYAFQAAQQAPDLPSLQFFLAAVLEDSHQLLVSIDRAEKSLHTRLQAGMPALSKVRP